VQVDLQRREILYRVAPGDTLWALAERFYGSARRWPEIAIANKIKEGEGLVSGRLIRIPLSVDAEADATPTPAAITVDIPREAPAARPFAIDESALGARRQGFPGWHYLCGPCR
jgi:hypothetical protein